ncbi:MULTISPECIES: hypothetical protein [Pseudomonas]|nr:MULTISPECIES: hypothetical protein [Pseudomonas]MCO7621244.1 hypothetical protein [Pseudomonas guariconensis]MDM9593267.1 hypothetical protein [Pseudomonas guariconensis]MDM9606094.1 hypothetical protein [Pseudomonas guariconensis]MDM9611051.1 hypothetical protein [Pseudomonas guariconensis]URD44181.1 hypothetical protein M6G63_08015 [Pseudomonas sp. BYT-5]
MGSEPVVADVLDQHGFSQPNKKAAPIIGSGFSMRSQSLPGQATVRTAS